MGNNQNKVKPIEEEEVTEKKVVVENHLPSNDELFFKVYRNRFLNTRVYSFLAPSAQSEKRYENMTMENCCERGLLNLLMERLRLERLNLEDRELHLMSSTAVTKFMEWNSDFERFRIVYQRFTKEFNEDIDTLITWHIYYCKSPNPEIIRYLRLRGHSIRFPVRVKREWFDLLKIVVDNPSPNDKDISGTQVRGYETGNYLIDVGEHEDFLIEVAEYFHERLPRSLKIEVSNINYEFLTRFYSKYPRFIFQGLIFQKNNDLFDYFANKGDFLAIKFIHESNPKRKCNPTAMVSAMTLGHFEIFKFLFLHKTSEYFIPFIMEYLYENTFDLHPSFIKFILDNIEKRSKDERLTPHHYEKLTRFALHSSNIELLDLLIERGVAVINNNFIFSVDMIQFLKRRLESFNEINLFSYYVQRKSGHLQGLMESKNFEFLRYIIDRLDSLENSYEQFTVLDMAVRTGSLEFFRYFHETGKSRISIKSLEWSITCKHLNILRYIVEDCKFRISDPSTLMQKALEYGNIESIDYLYTSVGIDFPQNLFMLCLPNYLSRVSSMIPLVKYLLSKAGDRINSENPYLISRVSLQTPEIIEMFIPYLNNKTLCRAILNHSNFKIFKKIYRLVKSMGQSVFDGDQNSDQLFKNMIFNHSLVKFLCKYDPSVLHFYKKVINQAYSRQFGKLGSFAFQIYLDMGIIETKPNSIILSHLLSHPSPKSMKIFMSLLPSIKTEDEVKSITGNSLLSKEIFSKWRSFKNSKNNLST